MWNPVRWLRERKLQSERNRRRQTCPRCLRYGSMVYCIESSTEAGEQVVRCSHYIDDFTEECDFTLPMRFLELPRTQIASLGMACVGETLWMTMLVDLHSNGAFPHWLLKGKFLDAEQMSHYQRMRGEHFHGLYPGATRVTNKNSIPLLINNPDVDDELLVLRIPCVGAKGTFRSMPNPLRHRQLASDGIIFFLDPTLDFIDQKAQLHRFVEDWRLWESQQWPWLIRRFRPHRLPPPIAVAVTKCDLLSSDIIDLPTVYSELSRIGQTTALYSLDQIRARSAWTQSVLNALYPEWNVAEDLKSLGVPQFEFFPIASIGMTEIGERDLSRRTIQPFGIVEPLLWLLHALGRSLW